MSDRRHAVFEEALQVVHTSDAQLRTTVAVSGCARERLGEWKPNG